MHKNKKLLYSDLFNICILSGFSLLSSCSLQTANDSNNNPSIATELELCSTSTTYSSFATVTGVANFSKRSLTVAKTGSTLNRLTLSGPISANLPIRFAEIRVLNAAGAVVQCGQTNSTGQLMGLDAVSALKIPTTAGAYTIEVLARANHAMTVPVGKTAFQAFFSIKEDIYSNTVYKITSSINVTGAGSFPTSLSATALESVSSKVEGGAFNIYNDYISAYDYLANNTSTQNITCLNPKLSTYWKAGFNPNQYIYPNNDPAGLGTVSFYLRGSNEIYINGGVLGNVSSIDTDHFDDAVIIHELGHHIENVCGVMESPGGSHNGSAKIDPRLAWSEGWGNFLAAHIIKNKLSDINPDIVSTLPNNEWLYYFDSNGYTDGAVTSGYEYIRFNLARPGNSTTETLYASTGPVGYAFDTVAPATYPGESHFREVSISRGLFKSTNTCIAPFANCVNQDNFSDIWKAFEKQSTGMGQSLYPFRNSARLLDRMKVVQGGSFSVALNNLFTTDEALQLYGDVSYMSGGSPDYLTWVPYGIKLVPSGSICYLQIQPKSYTNSKSDQRYSNHFYYIDKSALPGVTDIKLTAVYSSGSSGIDIDMLLFNEAYRFNEDGSSKTTSADVVTSDRTSAYPKNISISSLSAASKYLLNIRAFTPNAVVAGTKYNYTLTNQSGGYLCPSISY